jgi:hypothetical protein
MYLHDVHSDKVAFFTFTFTGIGVRKLRDTSEYVCLDKAVISLAPYNMGGACYQHLFLQLSPILIRDKICGFLVPTFCYESR